MEGQRVLLASLGVPAVSDFLERFRDLYADLETHRHTVPAGEQFHYLCLADTVRGCIRLEEFVRSKRQQASLFDEAAS